MTTYVSDVFNGAELQGFADGPMEPEFVEQVRDMDGIEKVLPIYVYPVSYTHLDVYKRQAPSRGHDLKLSDWHYGLVSNNDAPSRGHDLKQILKMSIHLIDMDAPSRGHDLKLA